MKAQLPKTFGVTVKSIFAVCIVYLVFSIPSTVVYASVRDAEGNYMGTMETVQDMEEARRHFAK